MMRAAALIFLLAVIVAFPEQVLPVIIFLVAFVLLAMGLESIYHRNDRPSTKQDE